MASGLYVGNDAIGMVRVGIFSSGGTDTSDATATASDIVSGKTAYANGEKVTGTLQTSLTLRSKISKITESTVNPSTGVGESYKVINVRASPITGISGKRVIDSDSTEIIIDTNASEFGNATASDVAKGKTFTSSDGLKVSGTMASKAAATYTPSTSNQTITSGQYLAGAQTIKGDTNLVAGNIKKGVSIFGVTGTLETSGSGGTSSGGIDTSDATATASDIVESKTAYVNGEKVTGTLGTSSTISCSTLSGDSNIDSYGSISYYSSSSSTLGTLPNRFYIKQKGHALDSNPTIVTEDTTFTIAIKGTDMGDATAADVASGKTFTSASGLKLTGTKTESTGLDTSDATASASDILNGKTAYVNGTKVTGTISKKTSASYTPGTSDQIISSGQYLAGPQTVKGDANLVADNIKKGVSIFGVTGTLESGGGTSLNNCEAYLITSTTQAVNFKNTGGTIKVWGYATQTSSSGWSSSTKLLAFDGDKYYTSVSYGSPTATSLSLSLNSDGTISGLPSMTGCNLLVTVGI